jgi:hypothetical protein
MLYTHLVPKLDAAQADLDRIVSGLTTFVLDFDGPATTYIGSGEGAKRYITLCSGGIKPEGEESPSYGWMEAIERYAEQLRVCIQSNKDKQLAWRCRPKLVCDGEAKYRVYSRLVFV